MKVKVLKRLLPVFALLVGLAIPAVAQATDGTLGTTTVGALTVSGGANYLDVSGPYNLAVSGTVSKLTAYVASTGAGASNLRGVIYADSSGEPGALVGVTSEITIADGQAAGWVDLPLGVPAAVSPGSYWIGFWIGGNMGVYSYDSVAGSERFTPDPYSSGGSPNDPFGPAGSSIGLYSVYATYTPTVTDTTPPTITGSRTPAANANGWNNTDVTVSFSCTDNPGGSGVATVSGPTTLSGEGAGQSVTGTCTDNAGNPASATVSNINIDKTAPTVSYAGNAGSYTVDQTVAITCTAADGLSGVASSTCANVSGPAYNFAIGTNTYSAGAADKAGNTGAGTTSFTVAVTPGSLCNLTLQFVQGSAKYQALSAKQKAAVDKLGAAVCTAVAKCTTTNATLKRLAVAVYKVAVAVLAKGGWITSAQSSTLTNLVGRI